MRFLVFGAGAVGCYVGGCLADAGHEVVFLARSSTTQAMASEGLVITGEGRAIHLTDPAASADLDRALARGAPDCILLTVKAFDAHEAAEQLAAAPVQAPVASFLNGVGSERPLTEMLGEGRVIAATLTTAVERESEAKVAVRRARGAGVAADHPYAEPLSESLQSAGIKVSLYARRQELKWSKLLTNLLANASSAVTGLPPARIYSHPGLYRLEIECLREALGAMRARDIETVNLPDAPVGWLARLVALPTWLTQPLFRRVIGGARGEKLPSLYYDVERGRTEVAWLNGAVVSACDRLGQPAPANRVLTQAVHTLSKDPSSVQDRRLTVDQLLANAAEFGVPGLRGYNRSGSANSGAE